MVTEQRNDSEALRREAAGTSTDMDGTRNELEDRVSPSHIRERQTQKVRSHWYDVRAQQATQSVRGNDQPSSPRNSS